MKERIQLKEPVTPDAYRYAHDIAESVENGDLTTYEDGWTGKVEKQIKEEHGSEFCLLTSCGTTAFFLLLSSVLKIWDIERVFMQDFTWRSTKDMAQLVCSKNDVGLEFVDVDPDTWLGDFPENIMPSDLIIPNMTFGNVKSYDHNAVLYDSAHCSGMDPVGARGLGEILSFSPAKPISASEGGAVLTNDRDIYETAKQMRRYHGRISEMNACLLYKNIQENGFDPERGNRQYSYSYYQHWIDRDCSIQNCAKDTNRSELVFNFKNALNVRDKLSDIIQIRTRYRPSEPADNPISKAIYDDCVILPVTDKEETNKIIRKING